MTLGLDINTNSTGYAVLDKEEKLVKYGYIDTSKEKDYFDKAAKFALQTADVFGELSFERIGVEDIIGKFASGKSSVKIIIALAQFNALASFQCFMLCKTKPEHINVNRARSLALGFSIPRGVNKKEFILKLVSEWYPEIEWPMMKRKKALAKQAYDISDAIIVAKAVLRL